MQYRYSPDPKLERIAQALDATTRALAILAMALAAVIFIGQWGAL
jgi:hypothetical protein